MKTHTNALELHSELDSMTTDALKSELFNRIYNDFIRDNCDDDEHAVQGGKSIPYIGWYWRNCDFYALDSIRIGNCGSFIGIMIKNKWDYNQRFLTISEAKTFLYYIDRAMCAYDSCVSVDEGSKQKWATLKELWNWMQTLKV